MNWKMQFNKIEKAPNICVPTWSIFPGQVTAYMKKHLRKKTFLVGIGNDCGKNFHGSSFF